MSVNEIKLVTEIGETEASNIKALASGNESAPIIFDALAHRKRVRKVINLGSFRHALFRSGKKVKSDEFYKLFQNLQNEGYGQLKENKFFPSVNLIRLGMVGIGKGLEEPKMEKEQRSRKVGRPRKRQETQST